METKPRVKVRLVSSSLWSVAVIALAWIALFFDTIRRVVDDWRVDENYSHGFLVPFVSAYAIWNARERIFAMPRTPRLLLGGAVTLLSILMLFAGILGAELYLARIAMLLSVVGLVLYFCGSAWLASLAFPIGIWFLAIPIPSTIFFQIALPLQLIASEYATRAIKLFGIPALREGNVIELAQLKLQVVEACSGIRSLISLATLAVVYVHFAENRWWRRIALVAAVIPIAIVANAARVAGTGIMAHFYGTEAAEGFLHSFSGWLVFLVAVLLLLAVSRFFNLIERIFHRDRKADNGFNTKRTRSWP